MKLNKFKKTEGISGATKEMVALIGMFEPTKKEVEKAIKKGTLFDELLVKYHCITTSLKYLLSDTECEEMILKDNSKLSKQEIVKLIDDMMAQSNWCNQQFQLRNEIRTKSNKELVNYNAMSKKLVESWEIVDETKESDLAIESKKDLEEISKAVEKVVDVKAEEVNKKGDSK